MIAPSLGAPSFSAPVNDSYLRGRVAQVFDAGSKNSPHWSIEDAHQVRAALDRLRWLELRAAKGRRG